MTRVENKLLSHRHMGHLDDQNIKSEHVKLCSSNIGMQSSTVELHARGHEDMKLEQLRQRSEHNLLGEEDGSEREASGETNDVEKVTATAQKNKNPSHIFSRKLLGEDDEDQNEWNTYPWCAPRIIWQYFENQTQSVNPTVWSIDNYDGDPTWIEMRMLPKNEYKIS